MHISLTHCFCRINNRDVGVWGCEGKVECVGMRSGVWGREGKVECEGGKELSVGDGMRS